MSLEIKDVCPNVCGWSPLDDKNKALHFCPFGSQMIYSAGILCTLMHALRSNLTVVLRSESVAIFQVVIYSTSNEIIDGEVVTRSCQGRDNLTGLDLQTYQDGTDA